MPVNPFQSTAEMQWGGYESKKSYRSQGQMGAGSLSGQGHRSKGWAPAAPEATLSQPRAEGRMPQGNADIKRPNYGAQTSEQPQRGSRRASFGGMGAGATKGGGGTTAGGDITIDLSQRIGSTEFGDGNTISGAVGQGAKVSDSLTGSSDSSVTDNSRRTLNVKTGNSTANTKTTTPAGTPSRRKTTPTPGEKTPDLKGLRTGKTSKKAPDTESSAPSSRSTASSRSTSGAASIRDIGEGFMSGGSKLTGAPVNIGRNRIDSDNVSRRTKTTKTDVRASGSATASADSKDARKVAPAKSKKETPAPEPTNASTPKEEPKAEATGKETIKEKAKKAVAKSATKVAAKATKSATKDKKVRAVKTAAKEEEE